MAINHCLKELYYSEKRKIQWIKLGNLRIRNKWSKWRLICMRKCLWFWWKKLGIKSRLILLPSRRNPDSKGVENFRAIILLAKVRSSIGRAISNYHFLVNVLWLSIVNNQKISSQNKLETCISYKDWATK